jgi:hypothetical protein
LLRLRREGPRRSRTAKCGEQFPPSDGVCHTPIPCEVRKRKDTTAPACSLQMAVTSSDANMIYGVVPGLTVPDKLLALADEVIE